MTEHVITADSQLPYGNTLDEFRIQIAKTANRGQGAFERTLFSASDKLEGDALELHMLAHGAAFHGWALVAVLGWIRERFGDDAAYRAASVAQDVGANGGNDWCDDIAAKLDEQGVEVNAR